MFPSACSLLYVFPLSFTTCFGLHGHLQVFRSLHIFKCLRILLRCFIGSLPFSTWSHSACFPFVFCSCAVFLRVFLVISCLCVCLLLKYMKIYEKIYTLEDGHVGRNMQWKTADTTYNKAACRRRHNLQQSLNNTALSLDQFAPCIETNRAIYRSKTIIQTG
jgi:hypothetical protein